MLRLIRATLAGEIASHFELTGWKQGTACQAAEKCFNVWLEDFGENGNREDRAILSQVRAFFEKKVQVGLKAKIIPIANVFITGLPFITRIMKGSVFLWFYPKCTEKKFA
ncbi:hypothetical protein [Legionella sp. WA2024007413]